MEFTITNLGLIFVAGLASVLSPCVLPVVPIVVTGGEQDSRLRPLFIVLGLSFTFVLMGILSSLAGSLIAGNMHYIEKLTGVIIVLLGLLLLFDKNPFKQINIFNRWANKSVRKGRFEGIVLGASLGLIWIPCIGPVLSSVLSTVAISGQLTAAIFMLLVYATGFSIPMLVAAYAAQSFRSWISCLQKNPKVLRILNGGILIAFGLYILLFGMLGMLI